MSESRPAGDDATFESVQRSFAKAKRIHWWIRACYFALIGEALLLYYGSSSTEFVARRPVLVHAPGCGEEEGMRG